MKAILKPYSILFAISTLLISLTSRANGDPEIEKTKTYSKSYSLSANDKVSISNQFGEVKLVTWDRSEIKTDVTIKVTANSEERAQELLDQIVITDGKSGSGVFFKTKINDKKNHNNSRYRNEKFSINYVVNLPSRNALSLSNSFGSTIVPDYAGEATIESKFGSLTAGAINNNKSITVEFGKASIQSVNNGDLTIKFSKAVVQNLSGDIDAEIEHSGNIKLGISNNIRDLSVKNNFSTLYLAVSKNLSASFDVRTNFGDFDNKTGFTINKEEENDKGPKFDHRYTGKAGNGSVAMKINSEFGHVVITHNLSMNLNDDKDAKKDKKKSRDI